MRCLLKSPVSWLFHQLFVEAQIKENIKASLAFVRGGFPAQRGNSMEKVSIWWCHHDLILSKVHLKNHANISFTVVLVKLTHCGLLTPCGITDLLPTDATLLSEPKLTNCQRTSMKFETKYNSFLSRRCLWKMLSAQLSDIVLHCLVHWC